MMQPQPILRLTARVQARSVSALPVGFEKGEKSPLATEVDGEWIDSAKHTDSIDPASRRSPTAARRIDKRSTGSMPRSRPAPLASTSRNASRSAKPCRHRRRWRNTTSAAFCCKKYIDLYWPEAKFTVHDIRTQTFEGPDGLKKLYDFAHSVFPMHKWSHSAGAFKIERAGDEATVKWRWIVSWKAEKEGVVSNGTYQDGFQKRNGQWKCLERISDVDPNWPAALFQPFIDNAQTTFKSS